MLQSRHAASAQHLQLGEGVLLAGVDPAVLLNTAEPEKTIASLLQESQLIGATKEGSVFRAVPDLLHTEARGQRTPAEGTIIPGKWTVTLSGVLLEVTARNLGRLFNVRTENAAQTRLFMPVDVSAESVMDTLCWIGSCADGLIAIELCHPISTGGLVFRTVAHGAGEMPFTFMAQQLPGEAALPFRIHLLKEAIT